MDQVDFVIRNYIQRLVRRSLPSTDGRILRTLSQDIHQVVINNEGEQDGEQKIKYLKKKYEFEIPGARLSSLLQTVMDLMAIKNKDNLASYLITLDSRVAAATAISSEISDEGITKSTSLNGTDTSMTTTFPSTVNSKNSLADRLKPYDKEIGNVDESVLVHSLEYALTGSPSDLFPFEGDKVKVPTTLNFGMAGLVYQILEPCLIFRRLTRTCSQEERLSQGSKISDMTETRIAFLSALQDELLKYSGYINDTVSPFFIDDSNNNLTLRRLHLLLSDWIMKLRFLNYLELSSKKLLPNEFISLLYRTCTQGNSMLAEASKYFFETCLKPFVSACREWSLLGKLEAIDTKKENFFIQLSGKNDENTIDRVAYLHANVPAIFTKKQSFMIYQIGKTISFLRRDCHELKWCEKFRERHMLTESDLYASNWKLDVAYREVTKYCFQEVLGRKYNLIPEMIRLHNFLLMYQGDFIDSILEKGLTILNQSSNALSSHVLLGILQDSIENTSVRDKYPPDVINRLDARVLDLKGYGTVGWEIFTLDYDLKFPLNKLFESQHKEYLRMFNFMLKLRRLSYLLNRGWTESNSLERRSIRQLAKRSRNDRRKRMDTNEDNDIGPVEARRLWILKTFKRLNVLRNEFIKFMNVLVAYLDNEVIDRNFLKFISSLKYGKSNTFMSQLGQGNITKSKLILLKTMKMQPMCDIFNTRVADNEEEGEEYNLDDLVELHSSYLEKISRCKILNNNSKRSIGKKTGQFYVDQINMFLEIMSKFVGINGEFNSLLVEMLSIASVSREGDTNMDRYNDYLNRIDDKLDHLTQSLTSDIINRFEDSLDGFTKDLCADHDSGLRYLGLMLSN